MRDDDDKHRRRFFLRMSFYDNQGNTFGERAIEIDSAWCGERPSFIDLERPVPGLGTSSFDHAVEFFHVRKLRREHFIRDAKRMGMSLADYLEDKEGWNGTRRQARIEQLEDSRRGRVTGQQPERQVPHDEAAEADAPSAREGKP
jgi:hypothetical protein